MTDDRIAFRLRLDGARFEGKRLPVDVTPELQRFERLVAEVAAQQWKAQNPGKNLPRHFREKFQLALVDVEDGSAIPVLERVSTSAYDALFDGAAADVNRAFGAVVAGQDLEAPWLAELRDFREFGETLEPGEAIELAPRTERVVRYTPEARERRFPKPPRRSRGKKSDQPQVMAGRLTAIDADQRSFTLRDLRDRELRGRYENGSLTDDMKAVLNSSSLAPIIRITGRFASDETGRVRRITDVDSVELFEAEREPWTRRLLELAVLEAGWAEGGGGEGVAFAALDAAREVLRALNASPGSVPGIFPTEPGGVQLEWVSLARVVSLEVTPDIEFSGFKLVAEDRSTTALDTYDLREAVSWVSDAIS